MSADESGGESCRVEMVDGTPVRVTGGGEWDDTDRAIFAEVVWAAKARYAATDAHDRPGATHGPEVAGSQAAPVDAHEAPDSLGVQDRAGLGEVGA